MSAHWSLGVLIGLPLLALGFAGFIVAGVLLRGWWKRNPDSFDAAPAHVFSWIGFGIAGLFVVVAAVGFFPYSSAYHRWQPTTGTVSEVNKRLVGNSDGMSEKIVVQYTDGRERGCNDTRCSLVKPGDVLTLSCKRSYQWASTPGWDCNFVSRGVR